jgi:hypothetical protein
MNLVRIRTALRGVSLGILLTTMASTTALAAPASDLSQQTQKPPRSSVSGPQSRPPFEPGSKDAKQMEKLGPTSEVKTDVNGIFKSAPASSALPMVGANSSIDFQTPLNYCYKNLVYTPVKNNSSSTLYIQVTLYNGSTSQNFYTSVPAGSYSYPAFYGVEGNYTAYMYVWNGSSYQYDEGLSNKNVCQVSVSRVYNTGGWVELKIQNTGTAYASQRSTELAPYPGSGTYTGTQYDYPTAGGAALYRWFSVGTSPYGIVSDTLSSTNSPYFFTGDL